MSKQKLTTKDPDTYHIIPTGDTLYHSNEGIHPSTNNLQFRIIVTKILKTV